LPVASVKPKIDLKKLKEAAKAKLAASLKAKASAVVEPAAQAPVMTSPA
jgi:hypothetical protein